jgi:hypothetical protein
LWRDRYKTGEEGGGEKQLKIRGIEEYKNLVITSLFDSPPMLPLMGTLPMDVI